MSDGLNLVAEDVHITYRTYIDPQVDLRARLRAGHRTTRRRHVDIHAVRGVSFELHRGESIGFVGHNGAGKSTLLLGLAGLIELDSGRVLARNRPQLLGVGSVLNTNLSGRRNIEIGCLAAGMSRAEIAERIDDLIDFSGLAEFIELPLKAYSSGMRARLSFTVATVNEPDVLLIDEALAVGDADFRLRAGQRIDEIREAAGSVVVVSHNTVELERMCDRIIWLNKGEVVREGSTAQILRLYTAARSNPDLLDSIASSDVSGIGPLRVMSIPKLVQARYGAAQVIPADDGAGRPPAIEVAAPVAVDASATDEAHRIEFNEMFAHLRRPAPPAEGATLHDWLVDHESGALMMEWFSPIEPRQAILLAETYSPWFLDWQSRWLETDDRQLQLDKPVPTDHVDAELVYCGTRFPAHFTHWWIDVAARVGAALDEPRYDGLQFIVPHPVSSFQLDALAALGLDQSRIYHPADEVERIATVHVPPMLQHGPRSATRVDATVLTAARRARAAVSPPTGTPSRRLYVSRRDEGTRHVTNAAEVESALRARGFEVVHPDELSFAQTVGTFAGADTVVGVTGDGLANVLFCDPGTAVVEILPETYRPSHIWALAALAQCPYGAVVGRAVGQGHDDAAASIDDDVSVPVAELMRMIVQLESARSPKP